MSSNYFDPSDDFSRNPFISLLPKIGNVSRLRALTPSLHARFENVERAISEVENVNTEDERKSLLLERKMLDQVFNWMNMSPQKKVASSNADLGSTRAEDKRDDL